MFFFGSGWVFVIDSPGRGEMNVPAAIASVVWLFSTAAIMLLVPAIVFFNVPKRFVPPHLRNELGSIAEGRQ